MGVTPKLLRPPPPQDEALGFCNLQTIHLQDEYEWLRDITHLCRPQHRRRRIITKIDTNTTNLGLEPKEANKCNVSVTQITLCCIAFQR